MSHYGLQKAVVKEFKTVALPYFLEGPARMMGNVNEETAREMYNSVKKTGLYDEKLAMYKTSASIEECSMENGRCRAFTPGWQERENVFLHMEYKYILSMIRAGICPEFYDTITRALIPFLDPNMYGRSTLENSSFIASSVNPNPDIHGRGFVARLQVQQQKCFQSGLKCLWVEKYLHMRMANLCLTLHLSFQTGYLMKER